LGLFERRCILRVRQRARQAIVFLHEAVEI
jgi:hypothetical protein